MRRNLPMVSAVFALLIVASVQAQQNRSSISGFVFGPDRRPVSQVMVELRAEFSTVGRVRTDGSGRFFFPNLAHGRYSLRVLPLGTGLLEQTEDVEIAGTGMRGQPVTDFVQKDIYLRARIGADSIPFQNAVIYAQEVPREAEGLYKQAVEDLDSQRTQSGIENLEKAVTTFPRYFAALQRLGIIRIMQENYDGAIQIFQRALEVNERCFDCWYGVAYANYTRRKFVEGRASAQKAVIEKPDSMEANLLLGMCLRMTKEFDLSERALKAAAKIAQGTSSDVHWHLALLYGKDMNKFAEAAKELEAFLKLSPDAPNKENIKKLIKKFKDKAKS